MTPKRKQALQYIHDIGELSTLDLWPNGKMIKDAPSKRMRDLMMKGGQLDFNQDRGVYHLTDKGRRALHEG